VIVPFASTETLRASPLRTSAREFTVQICGSLAAMEANRIRAKVIEKKSLFMNFVNAANKLAINIR